MLLLVGAIDRSIDRKCELQSPPLVLHENPTSTVLYRVSIVHIELVGTVPTREFGGKKLLHSFGGSSQYSTIGTKLQSQSFNLNTVAILALRIISLKSNMFNATRIAANRIAPTIASQLSRQQKRVVLPETFITCYKINRACLSSIPSLEDDDADFVPQSPAEITLEIAEGIADTTQFYMRHGLSRQRLEYLANQVDQPVLQKWQKMMEVFLSKFFLHDRKISEMMN